MGLKIHVAEYSGQYSTVHCTVDSTVLYTVQWTVEYCTLYSAEIHLGEYESEMGVGTAVLPARI